MRQTRLAVSVWSLLCLGAYAAHSSDASLYQSKLWVAGNIRSAMLASVRTRFSWEQGTAAAAVLEFDDPEYSVFGSSPFLAYSAAVRQSPDGRLSQEIGDALDGAALDGASAGSAVLLGSLTDPSRYNYWLDAANAQLNFLLDVAPRTSTGAISHRIDSRQYWADGVYMGFPFIAYFGAVTNNATLLQIAYDQCRLYRDALILDGPTGKLWGHIYSDDNKTWIDEGIWGTGNAWAAHGMLRVAVTIQKTEHCSEMAPQIANLTLWIKEILDGEFAALRSDNLIPNYITGGPSFPDAASSAALSSVAYRVAHVFPQNFGANYTDVAAKIRDAVVGNITNLGTMQPIVNPLPDPFPYWNQTGLLSTESQAFGLMMLSAWRDWIGA
ncbi:uncharacterized protein F5891DRAFT_1187693 [Suillus fuscotomentosus]|uniref:Six-hairpin glycosidase n=1 Tax=Suillus fuscotomentosus TaxID=1912939 RepID=A0AAD4HKV9_9AGAM|nr:uncharacterized protein F5891DRAFT_1187693 [Suillus fuscotomentosus]KAG1901410.1 hypothetical protein F5891DRAFT_1187693 [Suillus fuscotomentosus]